MTDDQLHRDWGADLHPFRFIGAIALEEVEQFTARGFHPADRFAFRDAAGNFDGQFAFRHVIQNFADDAEAFKQVP